MLELLDKQPIADMLLNIVDSYKNPATRQQAVETVYEFGRGIWTPAAFRDCLLESHIKMEDGILYWDQDSPVDPHQAVMQLLGHYKTIAPPHFRDYTTKEAAQFLGLSVAMIKKAVNIGTLKPEKRGHDLMFSHAQLMEYNRNHRKRGRPWNTQPQPATEPDIVEDAASHIQRAVMLLEGQPDLLDVVNQLKGILDTLTLTRQ